MPNDLLMRQVLKELESLRGEVRRGRKAEIPISLGSYLADFIALPGLVGFWPMSVVRPSLGTVLDISGRGLFLNPNGNLVFNQFTYSGGGPTIQYLDFDGTGDFLSRADEADLDILGTEAIFAPATRGITFGGWCWWDVAGTPGVTNRPFITKEPTTTYSPYQIFMPDSGQGIAARFSDSDAGTNTATPQTTGAVSLSAWHCVIADCVPGGTARLTVDGVEYTASAAALASLYNSSGAFEIGRGFGAQMLDGRAALCFLCANVLPADMKDMLWKRGKVLFGV